MAQPTRPTNRDLYLATDRDGRQGSYLSSEGRWQKVRALEGADRVIPVVGDLAGLRHVVGGWGRRGQRAQTFQRFRELTATPDTIDYRILFNDSVGAGPGSARSGAR